MLKKFDPNRSTDDPFYVGQRVYVILKDGAILEGYSIAQRLGLLIALDRSPLDGGDKQGFMIEGELLKPTWCAGRKEIVAAVTSLEQANAIAERRKSLRGNNQL